MPTWNKAYHANCWGALGGAPVGVTSIKDLYYRTFGDMNRAIADIGAAGYKGIELFDGNLLDYEGKVGELRNQLVDAGLNFLAVYSGGNFIFPEILPEELWRIRKGADLAAELGAPHLVVGGGAKRTIPAIGRRLSPPRGRIEPGVKAGRGTWDDRALSSASYYNGGIA